MDVTITLNGSAVTADKKDSLLVIARRQGVEIPTICHAKDLAPHGGCRLCLVELRQGTRSRLVASCGYFAQEGLVVETDSPRVIKVRSLLLELLRASMPDSDYIRTWADRYGVRATRYKRELTHCVLCGLCVRHCEEIKKNNCLGYVGRGVNREVAWVPQDGYALCEQCMECRQFCPTGVFPSNWGVANNSFRGTVP